MFYVDHEDNFYVLDEDLKVMRIVAKTFEVDQVTNTPEDLINISGDIASLKESTQVCDFVGTEFQKTVTSNLYSSVVSVVTKQNGDEEEYFNRADMINAISEISFEQFNTFNKLVVRTSKGVVLDIEKPTHNLQHKINICFSTIKEFLNSEDQLVKDKASSGTIKVFYDENNVMKTVYIP
jgi:hypothetical protein